MPSYINFRVDRNVQLEMPRAIEALTLLVPTIERSEGIAICHVEMTSAANGAIGDRDA